MITEVALPIPVHRTFSYATSDAAHPLHMVGRRVRVIFSGHEHWGIVVATHDAPSKESELQPLLEIVEEPMFNADGIEFCRRLCADTCAPLGLVLNRTLPRTVRHPMQDRRLVLSGNLPDVLEYVSVMERRAALQVAVLEVVLAADGPILERDISAALGPVRAQVNRLIELGLLQVVSGAIASELPSWPRGFPASGSVLFADADRLDTYRQLISATTTLGRQALIVVPEILSAQRLFRRVCRAAPGGAIYHSGLPEGLRGSIWERVRNGDLRWILGTRSALFLPFEDVGTIIVDEEQDASHKQSDMLPYFHARRAAQLRSSSCLVVLGTATPSLESLHATRIGALARLPKRISKPARQWMFVPPPEPANVLQPEILSAISAVLDRGARAVIGIPRRGYFQAVLCQTCRRPLRCRSCGTNLSVADRGGGAVCQHCGRTPSDIRCSHCSSSDVAFVGWGSLRVEDALAARFAGVDILRIDADTFSTSAANSDALNKLEETAPLILGTPMIAKGPPLDHVDLVVALDVDRSFAVPDFRVRERAYQYLSGLAGLTVSGTVMVSTSFPEREIFAALRSSDYETFAASELEDREALFYPPYSHLARLVLTRRDRARRRADAAVLRAAVDTPKTVLLGPAPGPKASWQSVYLLKSPDRQQLLDLCRKLRNLAVPLSVDIDPD